MVDVNKLKEGDALIWGNSIVYFSFAYSATEIVCNNADEEEINGFFTEEELELLPN